MYGRVGFDLLHARLLPYLPAAIVVPKSCTKGEEEPFYAPGDRSADFTGPIAHQTQ
jgi:hypothetical protein